VVGRSPRTALLQNGALLGTLAAAGAACVVALPVQAAASRSRTSTATTRLLYVANDAGPVTAYALTSSGRVSPARSIPAFDDANSYWDPWGVAFDGQGNLYVQSFLSDATTFVFKPGGIRPARIFQLFGPDVASVAVDAKGYEYTIGGEGPPLISVAAPGANGKPASLYQVPTLRSIYTDGYAQNEWPSSMVIDSSGEIVAAIGRGNGNAIEVFAGGPKGSAVPRRVISGSSTGLGSCAGGASCSFDAITWAKGLDYVAVTAPAGVRLEVFAGSSHGNVRPLRMVSGSRTGFAGRIGTGIAVDPATGLIYVLIKKAQFFSSGIVEVFAATASGNVAPIRTFTDSHTNFAEGQGLAIG
jgi:hypothetical protein